MYEYVRNTVPTFYFKIAHMLRNIPVDPLYGIYQT